VLKLITWPIRLVLTPLLTLFVIAYIVAAVEYFEPWKPKPAGKATPAPEGAGWEDLLSAANAPQWKDLAGTQTFEMQDGALHIPPSPQPFIKLKYATFTKQTYGDFDLHLEFKLGDTPWWSMIPFAILSPQMHGNSGVFLRVPKDESALRGFEVQVVGDYGWPASKTGTGAIYDVVTPMFNMARPVGEWNSYDISTRGTKVTVTVNGWKVIDTDFAQLSAPVGKFSTPYAQLPLEGQIALQDHGGEITYRNIRIRPSTGGTPVPAVAAPATSSETVSTTKLISGSEKFVAGALDSLKTALHKYFPAV
jgi:hypothetical protein